MTERPQPPSSHRAALLALLPELLPEPDGPVLVVAPWGGPAETLRDAGMEPTARSVAQGLPEEAPDGGFAAALLVEWSGDPGTLPARLERLHALLAPRGRALFAGPLWRHPDDAERHGEVAAPELTRRLYEAAFAVLEEGRRIGDEGKTEETDAGRCWEVQVARRARHVVRSYRPGDETAILDLFAEAFGFRRSAERWRWQYRDNPWGGPLVSVATDPRGRVLAHYAGYPTRVWSCLGSEPEVLPVLQIGDTMTARGARRVGRGVTTLLHRTTRHFYAAHCRGRVAFNWGVNTGKIQRYYRRIGELGELGPVPHRTLRVADAALPRLALLQRLVTGFRVDRVTCFDGRWDALFRRVRGAYGVLAERTARSLNWRYRDCPDTAYATWAVYRRGRLVGWSTFRRDGATLVWGDGLFDPGCPRAPGLVLAAALAAPEHAGVERVEGWLSSHPAWWDDAVRRLGFVEQPDPQGLVAVYVAFEREPDEELRANLYYTKGDSDLF